MRQLRAHWGITLVLLAFGALGVLYSVATPLFEAPDEQWHFAFVQHVATGRGLPVQTTGTPTHLARQEGSQPPLYYLLAAAATFWIDTSDYPGIVWDNPHYGFNVPGIVNDNKNLFIHTALEKFPWHGAPLALHLARLVSVLMGALAVLFTYLLSLEVFPDRKFFAASAGACAGFVPQFLFVSGAVSNDSTIAAMTALALWMIIRILIDRRLPLTDRRAWFVDVVALGITTGFAALAKVSGLGLVALGALMLLHANWKHPRALLRDWIVFGALVALIAGWWYARNLALYGEVTGTAMMNQIFHVRQAPLTFAQLLVQLREVWETFWIGFGWGNVRAHPAFYAAMEILVAASGVGLLLGFFHRRDRFHITIIKAIPFFVLAFWITVVFVELVSWMQSTQAPHGRLFFPTLPAIAPLAVFGLTQWFPRRAQPYAARAVALGLFGVAALAPFTTLTPAYTFPPTLAEKDLPATLRAVNIVYAEQMELLGYETSARRALPGEAITLTLYWRALKEMDEDYSLGVRVLDADQQIIGARDSYPGRGMLPTSLWRAGQIIRDAYWLPINADASAPGIAHIQVALYSRETKRDLPAHDPYGQAITPRIGAIKIASPVPVPAPRVQFPLDLVFDDHIALIGYDWQTGVSSQLTLYWKRLAPLADDYTVFVHVLDANGVLVAQHDQMPARGANPTSLWDENEIVADRYAFDQLKNKPGAFRLVVGLYRAESGERLPVRDGKGNVLGDAATLGSLGVTQ